MLFRIVNPDYCTKPMHTGTIEPEGYAVERGALA